jgi:hypothetical protein
MAIVFLDAVNASLKRVRVIQGDQGELVTSTSTVTSTATGGTPRTEPFERSGIQVQIDLMLQMWQEGIDEVYLMGLFASGAASATIALVSGTREYAMPDDFESFVGDNPAEHVFRGATTGLIVTPYHGGYARMLRDQPVATDYLGSPNHWARNPVDGAIRFDREPTTEEDGNTYNALYQKTMIYDDTSATETLPFTDTVANAMVPVVAEGWNRVMKKEFDSGLFRTALARATRRVGARQPKTRYGRRRRG